MSNRILVKIWDSSKLPTNWFKRPASKEKADLQVKPNVKSIISKVVEKGDAALIELTKKFDKAIINAKDLRVTSKEIKEAHIEVSQKQISAIKLMKEKVGKFEKLVLSKACFKKAQDGVTVQNVLRPIESVGCYVPGGQAAYPSTLVMAAVPARAAGVPRIVVCSPPNAEGRVNPLILAAADICGVNEVYKIGGAQAIAALAYGTKTIKPVKKIVGPGNKYVTIAKILVSKDVTIDMPAGPSEVLVLADKTANPKFIALDMISQVEHGGDSVAGLITTSKKLAEEVQAFLSKIVIGLDRREIVEKAL
ncbi:MAG: histidinol dehydrogenase, partial [Candidatus Bathyarchaeota archaeon]|nr:histidinol dehydrogenase [Candidatus Bathyarchaeota archaeon]